MVLSSALFAHPVFHRRAVPLRVAVVQRYQSQALDPVWWSKNALPVPSSGCTACTASCRPQLKCLHQVEQLLRLVEQVFGLIRFAQQKPFTLSCEMPMTRDSRVQVVNLGLLIKIPCTTARCFGLQVDRSVFSSASEFDHQSILPPTEFVVHSNT